MKVSDLAPLRVAVWGAGAEGIAAVQALRSRLPENRLVVMEEAANPALPAWLLADGQIETRLGPVTPAALGAFDAVIRSPGISIYRDEIVQAKRAGVAFTSGTNLWFAENAACRTVCVTGSKGKSTTTHLVHHLLEASGVPAKMAGNMGVPLLNTLTPDKAVAWHVVELSSYQLSDFTGAPTVAVLLNLYPEHLDWHRGEHNYFRDKTSIFARATQTRVINQRDHRSLEYAGGLDTPVYFNSPEGFHHDAVAIYHRQEVWAALEDLQLLGAHNLSNICAALTAVAECGIALDKDTVRGALRGFKGLNHRLTRLGERDGVLYVNDSIATIPQATAAALRAFSNRPTTVLVGGFDRGLDQREFARLLLAESPFAIITLPVTGGVLCQELRARASQSAAGAAPPAIHEAADLEHAVSTARTITPAGGVVLLSPGAPSFNSHRNFAERGEAFARAAGLSFKLAAG